MHNLPFKRSAKGRVEWAARSPFQNDESLMIQLKLWARVHLEHLTVQKCADYTVFGLDVRAVKVSAIHQIVSCETNNSETMDERHGVQIRGLL
jgi:hypothetical protein